MAFEMKMILLPSRDQEGTWRDDEHVQHDIRDVEQGLRDAGAQFSSQVYARKSMDFSSLLTGEFGITILSGSGILATALKAWISGRMGRKVRLKSGDIEVEASSVKELESLLAKAKELSSGD